MPREPWALHAALHDPPGGRDGTRGAAPHHHQQVRVPAGRPGQRRSAGRAARGAHVCAASAPRVCMRGGRGVRQSAAPSAPARRGRRLAASHRLCIRDAAGPAFPRGVRASAESDNRTGGACSVQFWQRCQQRHRTLSRSASNSVRPLDSSAGQGAASSAGGGADGAGLSGSRPSCADATWHTALQQALVGASVSASSPSH